MRFRSVSIVLLLTSCLLNACKTEDERNQNSTETISRVSIDTLQTFTDFETHDIAQPVTLLMLHNGNIAITDFAQKRINIVSPEGELTATFGREGRGPGEFLRPDKIIETDVISVIDSDLHMISQFDHEGNLLDAYPFASDGIFSEAVLLADSIIVTSTGGKEDALLSITNIEEDSTLWFGEPKGKSFEVVDFQESISQLKSGEIPDLYKNQVKLQSTENHIYAYLHPYSELHKYDASGNLIWKKKLEFPYNEDLFEKVVELAKKSPGGLPAINYISEFKVIDNEIYFLTIRRNKEDPQLLVQISDQGDITRICTLPTGFGYFSDFELSPETNKLYIASSNDGIVYKTEPPF